MARLIIGHTTEDSVKIWIRGDIRYPYGFVSLTRAGKIHQKTVPLEERHFFTGIAEFKNLKADTEYTVGVTFGETKSSKPHHRITYGHCDGKVLTFPKKSSAAPFSFIFGSCNLHSLGIFANPDKAFERITDVAMDSDIRFMIHCGDQIYYDIPNYWKPPNLGEYREKYLDAWGDSRKTRKFLTLYPQYMILDDHEITNDFANDMDASRANSTPKEFRAIATKVYREFQHIRHPKRFGNQALYYDFSIAGAEFFVLDTRTERYQGNGTTPARMIGESQMNELLSWLKKHKNVVKFIVTSVPFVFEVRDGEDKWCGNQFSFQREKIIAHIVDNGITGVIFLTGDMHCSGHCAMNAKKGGKTAVIHELMSSPINQIGKSSIDDFYRDRQRTSSGGVLTYRSKFLKSEFYDHSSNATVVKLDKRKISFESFRTRKTKIAIPMKTFTV